MVVKLRLKIFKLEECILSDYWRKIVIKYNISVNGVKKIIPNLSCKDKHDRIVELGIRLTIHRVLIFK